MSALSICQSIACLYCMVQCILAVGSNRVNIPAAAAAATANTHAPSDSAASQINAIKQICRKLCTGEGAACPPECSEVYLDPWVMDYVPTESKRAHGIDGFTFDDYLFLRWIGRDMKRRSYLN